MKEGFKFFIKTMGCRANQYESQAYIEQLEAMGGVFSKDCDIFILNSCAVTEKAEGESIDIVKKFSKRDDIKIFVTGCAADKIGASFKNVISVPNSRKGELVKDIFKRDIPFRINRFRGHTRAFLKIQDGCNRFCSYCIVPYTRGRSRSRSFRDILKEVLALVKNGYREIVLTGINIGDYKDLGFGLLDLLKRLIDIEGLYRIRISSIDPSDIDWKMARFILENEKMAKSMHISLQSGSDRILRLMKRGYSKKEFLEKVSMFESFSDFTITTDLIVGFPSESEKDFEETLEMVEIASFLKVHIFPFSRREGTAANNFSDVIDRRIIKRRREALFSISSKKSYEVRDRYLKRRLQVLTEENNFARSSNFLSIEIRGEKVSPNSFLDVFILENSDDRLIAEVVG